MISCTSRDPSLSRTGCYRKCNPTHFGPGINTRKTSHFAIYKGTSRTYMRSCGLHF